MKPQGLFRAAGMAAVALTTIVTPSARQTTGEKLDIIKAAK